VKLVKFDGHTSLIHTWHEVTSELRLSFFRVLYPQGTSEADGPALAALLAARRMAAPEIVRCHQDFSPPDTATAPVGEPIEKDRAKLQARGGLSAARVPQTPDGAAPCSLARCRPQRVLRRRRPPAERTCPVVPRVRRTQRTAPAPSAAATRPLRRRTGPPLRPPRAGPAADAIPFTLPSAAQASGEALYTSDIVMPPDGLFGVFVESTEALAELKGVDAGPALALPGVAAYIDIRDVPKGGANLLDACGTDIIFADGRVEYVGQRIGIVLAESQVGARELPCPCSLAAALIRGGWPRRP
jgi:hypothetical protein